MEVKIWWLATGSAHSSWKGEQNGRQWAPKYASVAAKIVAKIGAKLGTKIGEKNGAKIGAKIPIWWKKPLARDNNTWRQYFRDIFTTLARQFYHLCHGIC